MKFNLLKASDGWTIKNEEDVVDINTLDDLEELQEKYKRRDYIEDGCYDLIINFKRKSIMVYDCYIE